jgi:zinc transport system substrate-binding protein
MFNRILVSLVFFTCFEVCADTPKVVVSIKPIHALVAGVMKGIGQPQLLLTAQESSHHFSLTPAKAETISRADLFVWIGPQMESALESAVKALPRKGRILTIAEIPDITKLELEPGQLDPHLWLDPKNAKVIVSTVSTMLSAIDPHNAGVYQENAKRVLTELDQLNTKLFKELEPIRGMQYLVYHDAFQYYERAFDLSRSTPVVKDTEHTIRASQRTIIDTLVREKKVQCIFGEPNHGEKVVESLAEQLNLRLSFLDPVGTTDRDNPESSYFDMMEDIASSLKNCLLQGPKT